MVSVPFVLPYPCASRPSYTHIAFIHTSRSSGSSIKFLYFVIVSFVIGCTTSFAYCSMSSSGVKMSILVCWSAAGLYRGRLARNALPSTEYNAACEMPASPLCCCTWIGCCFFILGDRQMSSALFVSSSSWVIVTGCCPAPFGLGAKKCNLYFACGDFAAVLDVGTFC